MIIKVADKSNIKDIKKLLLERDGDSIKLNIIDYFYLDNAQNGFTLLVFNKKDIPIAISSFSIRLFKTNYSSKGSLYWENLFVSPSARNGLAYLTIVKYIKNLIKENKFSDIYFLVHKAKPILIHSKMGFKKIKTISLLFAGFKFKTFNSKRFSNDFLVYKFDEIEKMYSIREMRESICKNINWTKESIKRQISYKDGIAVYSKINNEITMISYKKILPFVNIIIFLQGNSNNRLIHNIKNELPYGLNIFTTTKRGSYINFTIKKFFLFSLRNNIDSNNFNLLEHDAF